MARQGRPPWVGQSGEGRSPPPIPLGLGPFLNFPPLLYFPLFPHGLSLDEFVSPLCLIAHPINPCGPLEAWWAHPVGPRNPFVTPGTLPTMLENFPESKHQLPIYQSLFPDHSENPHDVCDLIRDSDQPSVTSTYNSTILKHHRTLSVQTLRVRELCRHELRHSSVNIQ